MAATRVQLKLVLSLHMSTHPQIERYASGPLVTTQTGPVFPEGKYLSIIDMAFAPRSSRTEDKKGDLVFAMTAVI